jgi:UTP--glucose-1-phosphate uridylyltransferase
MTFQRVTTAIFPVGGLGTRFLPATKAMPKEMLPVVDKPLIQYAVEEARAAGIKEIIFVTGRGKSAIEDHFDLSGELDQVLRSREREDLVEELHAIAGPPGSIAYLRQQTPLGLGHAVWTARHLIGDRPFAVLLADDLIHSSKSCLKQMMEAYDKIGGNIIAAMEVPDDETHRYGIVDPEKKVGRLTRIKGLVEKPKTNSPSCTAVIGRYILQPQIMDVLGAQESGSGGEIQLTDAIAKLIETQEVHAFEFEGQRFDCGDKVGHICANIALALERKDLRDGIHLFLKKNYITN